jgi:hypothetical protein
MRLGTNPEVGDLLVLRFTSGGWATTQRDDLMSKAYAIHESPVNARHSARMQRVLGQHWRK